MKAHALLWWLCSLVPLYGQGTMLIGSNVLNGDFEDGVPAPWRSLIVLQSASFAQSGSWYAVSSGDGRRSVSTHISPIQSDGSDLFLSFYGRIAEGSGTPSLSPVFTGGGLSTREIIAAPQLVSSEWSQFEFAFHLGASWNYSSYHELYITIPDNIVSTVFLDNVQLTQVPEPSATILVPLGALFLVVTRLISNKPDAVNPAIASRFHSGYHWRGVTAPER